MRTGRLRRVLHTSVLLGVAATAPALAGTTCPVELGQGASLGGMLPFPADNPWNKDISAEPVDPLSNNMIAKMGFTGLHPDFGAGFYNGSRIGMPYIVVPEDQPLVPINITGWPGESDAGPFPVPADAPIEEPAGQDRDRHVLVVQRDPSKPNCLGKLYELYQGAPVGGSRTAAAKGWSATSTAVFDLNSNALRPIGWTSADAAGLPIFPGLVRYDEVAAGEIRHAVRFTVPLTRRAFVDPARHWASLITSPYVPPMGARVRLKASFDIPATWPTEVQVILRALKKYGMIVADHGGGWFITGAPDERWNNDELVGYLYQVKGNAFEVVKMGTVVTPQNIASMPDLTAEPAPSLTADPEPDPSVNETP